MSRIICRPASTRKYIYARLKASRMQPVSHKRSPLAQKQTGTIRRRIRSISPRPVDESPLRVWLPKAPGIEDSLDVPAQPQSRLGKRMVRGDAYSCIAERRLTMNHATIIWPNWLPRVLWFRHACPCCNSVQFKPSEMHSLDVLFSMFALRSVRCTFCWRRYYWFSLRVAQ